MFVLFELWILINLYGYIAGVLIIIILLIFEKPIAYIAGTTSATKNVFEMSLVRRPSISIFV